MPSPDTAHAAGESSPQLHLPALSLRFAIPDHPWVDSADGAAVRIAMTVGAAGAGEGRLAEVVEEIEHGEDAAEVTLRERIGLLHANLAIGANVGCAVVLQANNGMSHEGVKLHGMGFVVTPEEAAKLGLGRVAGLKACGVRRAARRGLAKSFKGAKADRVADILETLASLGQARALKDGRYVTA